MDMATTVSGSATRFQARGAPASQVCDRRSWRHHRRSLTDRRACALCRFVLVKREDRKPRSFVANERAFGRFERVEWDREALVKWPDAGLAAQWQHVIVLLTRTALHMRGMTQEELAAEMGYTTQYVRDRIGGHRWLGLTDAATLQRVLGVRVLRPASEFEVPVDWRDEPEA